MTEEQVTKSILKWLEEHQWKIVCFDFPQSGTGRLLHPNNSREKNEDAIIPDIVAVQGRLCLFFENKDRYYYPDFVKQHKLITENPYTDAIAELLRGRDVREIYYGIGLPATKFRGGAVTHQQLVDFIVGTAFDREPAFLFHKQSIPIF